MHNSPTQTIETRRRVPEGEAQEASCGTPPRERLLAAAPPMFKNMGHPAERSSRPDQTKAASLELLDEIFAAWVEFEDS